MALTSLVVAFVSFHEVHIIGAHRGLGLKRAVNDIRTRNVQSLVSSEREDKVHRLILAVLARTSWKWFSSVGCLGIERAEENDRNPEDGCPRLWCTQSLRIDPFVSFVNEPFDVAAVMSVLKKTTAHAMFILGVVRGEDHDYHEIQDSIHVQLENSAEIPTSNVISVISSEPVEELDLGYGLAVTPSETLRLGRCCGSISM